MSDDQTFRLVLLTGFLLLFPFALYYRLRSQATGEKLDRWQEGPFILFTLRAAGIAFILGLIAFLIDPSRMVWAEVPLPRALRWAGVGVGILGGSVLAWTLPTLGPNLTDTVVTRRSHTLVTTGPYRWVRHPFYVGVALSIAANSLAAANWFLMASGAAVLGLIGLRTRIEEEKLRERFGAEYDAYRQRTGRFFPRITSR
jgi:protein-S-isoprenylcysteine O-methyltransferase Ste14